MKKIFRHIPGIATVALLVGGMASCTSEAPFSQDGETLVRMNVSINPKLTRADDSKSEYQKYLEDNCVIYISNSKGLLHKYIGVNNVPQEGIYMRYGSYVAEAWSGDSVTAAYESEGKKFFRGYQEFNVGADTSTEQVTVLCKIANVVASVNEETINNDLVENMTVKFANTRGELDFTSDNWADKGYFMMPTGDNTLTYTITGTRKSDGQSFTKSGKIENVERAHEYRVNFKYNPSENTDGGAFLTIIIDDSVIEVEDEIEIYGRPAFAWDGNAPEIGGQIIGTPGTFITKTLRIAANGLFTSVNITASDPIIADALGGNDLELVGMTQAGKDNLAAKGIVVTEGEQGEDISRYFIQFTADWLNALVPSDSEYVLTVTATDSRGKEKSVDVRIANTEAAIVYADPIIIDTDAIANDFTAVGAKSANLKVSLTTEDVENPAIQYRAEGESAWNTVAVNTTRAAGEVSVRLTGLTPATTYEYRAVAGSQTDGTYEFESEIYKLTTESIFTIPNASMEDWGEYSAQTMLGKKTVIFPGLTRDDAHEQHFWDSGNEGGATANKTLTNKSTDMVHSGTYSARLASDAALGIIAAGNLFTGYYVRTDGTNGVLSLGHVYNGSHPSKLRVYVNYRPATGVTVKKGEESNVEVTSGGLDHGRILVALSDGAVDVRTDPNNRKLLSPDDDQIVAYGDVTWKEDFSADGQLTMVEIPIEYNERAKTKRPTHLVIVCAASKFGDYFTGAKGSVMYVDDFELVYE